MACAIPLTLLMLPLFFLANFYPSFGDNFTALACVAQLVGASSMQQKVAGSIPRWGMCGRQSINVSVYVTVSQIKLQVTYKERACDLHYCTFRAQPNTQHTV